MSHHNSPYGINVLAIWRRALALLRLLKGFSVNSWYEGVVISVKSGKRIRESGVPRVERRLGGPLLEIGELYQLLLMGERRPTMCRRVCRSKSDDFCA